MTEKFLEKNRESINKLNEFIKSNNDNIRLILTSTEIFYVFKELPDVEILDEQYIKYMGKRVIIDQYYPSSTVSFVMNNNNIEFNLPCVCGYYNDEPHK